MQSSGYSSILRDREREIKVFNAVQTIVVCTALNTLISLRIYIYMYIYIYIYILNFFVYRILIYLACN